MCTGEDGFPPQANNKKLEQVRSRGRMLFIFGCVESLWLKKVLGLLDQGVKKLGRCLENIACTCKMIDFLSWQ